MHFWRKTQAVLCVCLRFICCSLSLLYLSFLCLVPYFLSKLGTPKSQMLPATLYQDNKPENERIYFHAAGKGENITLSVDGGGVNSTISIADIATTDGVIHVIDRILGIPYQNVYDKLESDPMLRWVKKLQILLFLKEFLSPFLRKKNVFTFIFEGVPFKEFETKWRCSRWILLLPRKEYFPSNSFEGPM